MISLSRGLKVLPPAIRVKLPSLLLLSVPLAFFLSFATFSISISSAFQHVSRQCVATGWDLAIGIKPFEADFGDTSRLQSPSLCWSLLLSILAGAPGLLAVVRRRFPRTIYLAQSGLGVISLGALCLAYWSLAKAATGSESWTEAFVGRVASQGSFHSGIGLWLSLVATAAATVSGWILFRRPDLLVVAQDREVLDAAVARVSGAIEAALKPLPPTIHDIHLWDGKEWVGPYDAESLRDWMNSGRISGESYVCRLGNEAVMLRDLLAAPASVFSSGLPPPGDVPARVDANGQDVAPR